MNNPATNLNPDDNPDDQNLDDNLNQDDHINDEPQISQSDQDASQLGWQPKDQWEGDPDEWTSSKRFLQTREIIESNKTLRANQDRMEHDFNKRLDGVKQFHDQQLKSKIEDLKNKRDSAAEDGEMETYKEANKQLDELENQEVSRETPQQPVNQQEYAKAVYEHPVTQKFVNENDWIRGNSPKAVYAQKVFADYLTNNSANGTIEEGLNLVTESVNREFPQNNPNRQTNNQMGDRGNGPRKQAQRNRLTMDDLTREETGIWNAMGSTYKDQAEFLQAVADSRKGE